MLEIFLAHVKQRLPGHRHIVDERLPYGVEITAAETVGVEERAAFYEETGALRDMVPNHLFQLLSLVAMEPPASLPMAA